jgi:DNA polymerase-1
MLNIQRRLKDERLEARMLLQIHDELVFETPAKDEKRLVKLVHDEMTRALAERLQVPLRVDMGIGANWMDTTEVNL